jgi:hypothetical protein
MEILNQFYEVLRRIVSLALLMPAIRSVPAAQSVSKKRSALRMSPTSQLPEVSGRAILLCERLRLRSQLIYLDERRARIYYFNMKIKGFEVTDHRRARQP